MKLFQTFNLDTVVQSFFIFKIHLYFADHNILDALYRQLEDRSVTYSDIFVYYQLVVVFNVGLMCEVVILLQDNFNIWVIPYIVWVGISLVEHTFLYLPDGAQQNVDLLNFKNGRSLELIQAHVLYDFQAEGILYKLKVV